MANNDDFWDFAAFWEFFNPFEDEEEKEITIECPLCKAKLGRGVKIKLINEEKMIFECPSCRRKLKFDKNLENLITIEEEDTE